MYELLCKDGWVKDPGGSHNAHPGLSERWQGFCLSHATKVLIWNSGNSSLQCKMDIDFLGFECGSLVYFYCCGVLNSLARLCFFLCEYNVNSTVPFLLGAQVVELDLKTVVPCCSGPKRPQDKVAISDMKKDFESCLGAKVGTWERWVEILPNPAPCLASLCTGFTALDDESSWSLGATGVSSPSYSPRCLPLH